MGLVSYTLSGRASNRCLMTLSLNTLIYKVSKILADGGKGVNGGEQCVCTLPNHIDFFGECAIISKERKVLNE